MSDNQSYRGWLEGLKHLTAQQLLHQYGMWSELSHTLCHAQGRDNAARRMRDVEKEMDRREEETSGDGA